MPSWWLRAAIECRGHNFSSQHNSPWKQCNVISQYIPDIYMYVPCISWCKAYPILNSLYFWHTYKEAMKVGRIGNTCTLHGSTGQHLECTQKICFTHSQDTMIYTMYIPCIYHVYTSHLTVWARFVAHRTSLGSSQSLPQRGRPCKAGAVQSSTARCWSSKPSTIGTAALKSVQLSAAVFLWNSWGSHALLCRMDEEGSYTWQHIHGISKYFSRNLKIF
jgi:hypothetical protein